MCVECVKLVGCVVRAVLVLGFCVYVVCVKQVVSVVRAELVLVLGFCVCDGWGGSQEIR